MKRFFSLLVTLLLLGSANVTANVPEELLRFVSSYCVTPSEGGCKSLYMTAIAGDEVTVEGKEYLRYTDYYAGGTHAALLRQEQKRIYCFDQETNKEVLLFDFDLQKGDTYTDELQHIVYKVVDVRDSIINAETVSLIELQGENGEHDIWMQEVGSIYTGILRACNLHSNAHLVFCGMGYKYEFHPHDVIYKFADMSMKKEDFVEWLNSVEDWDALAAQFNDDIYELENWWRHRPTDLNAEFIDDTLHVWGHVASASFSYHRVTCSLTDNVVCIQMYAVPFYDECDCLVSPADVDIRIPGFQRGEYQIDLFNKTVNAACVVDVSNPTAGIKERTQDFAFRLFDFVEEQTTDGNILCSPLSMTLALAMLENGAAGNTLTEIQKALNLTGYSQNVQNDYFKELQEALPKTSISDYWLLDDPNDYTLPQLEIANSVWAQNGMNIRDSYRQKTVDVFNATARNVDFTKPAAADEINQWVSDKTHGMIDKLLQYDPLVVLALINTVYFKAPWQTKFEKIYTQDADFTNQQGVTKKVPMMFGEGGQRYLMTEGCQGVQLYYGYDEKFSMTVILPDEDDFQLTAEKWQALRSSKPSYKHFFLWMPRFAINQSINFNEILQKMGMSDAFANADFSNLTTSPIFVSLIKQVNRIAVDEDGTEAASATVAAVTSIGMGTVVELRLNRPFYFTIEDNKSGTILFVGKVNDIDTSNLSAIADIPTAAPQSPIYDLQGRQLQHEPARGVFIKDGRKWVK